MAGKNTAHTATLKKRMLAAMEKTLGIVTDAAKKAGIHRSAHYGWLKEDAEYKRAVDSIGDMALDFTESRLLKAIRNDNVTAQIFYLKTKGKKRGYVERLQLEDLGGDDGDDEFDTTLKV